MTQRDTVVVGAGLMGAATAWALARRGRPVTVLEQFAHDHDRGSARIVRRAYGDELYTRLTGEAFELWRELETTSGVPLLRMLGGLDLGAPERVRAVSDYLVAGGGAGRQLACGARAIRARVPCDGPRGGRVALRNAAGFTPFARGEASVSQSLARTDGVV